MSNLEQWMHQVTHHYVLIAVAAILFFAVKAVIGYLTYRHYDQQLKEISEKLSLLLHQHTNESDHH